MSEHNVLIALVLFFQGNSQFNYQSIESTYIVKLPAVEVST